MTFRILRETKKFPSKASPWKEEHEERVVVVAATAAAATSMKEADKAGKKGKCEVG